MNNHHDNVINLSINNESSNPNSVNLSKIIINVVVKIKILITMLIKL